MASSADLPCDGDGACMVCKLTPPEPEVMTCRTCVTPWHVPCLSSPPETLALTLDWQCPDCSPLAPATADVCPAAAPAASSGLVASIRAIEADASLTEQEKARRRQELLSRGPAALEEDGKEKGKKTKGKGKGNDDVLDLLDENFSCSFCMQLPDRPVTTPCGHNFCLKCFQKWVGQGKHTCAKCRAPIPQKMYSQPRINSSLVTAIRLARAAKSPSNGTPSESHFIRNENRPDKAFTTERAKKTGKANACSGQIFVTVPPDHFGPILAQYDPKRNKGVLVGELWEDRMECRQWGVHLPHVAGIAGQSDYGAQSVALSGGYADDEDHGEWFLYTGSGGRDLSGNKRTNKDQSFDQKFDKYNEALRLSCKKGYPVRVVRSHKEKRSSYAPETGVRYDGIFRIEKCWRKVGIQGFKVCRYLFVRCDNEPAPWTSDVVGDRPRPLPDIKELKNATDITVRKENPAWDYDEENGWKWMKPPPPSRKMLYSENSQGRKRARKTGGQNLSVSEKLLKEFSCLICRKVMTGPLTTPCDHNFCKSCLLESYADQSFMRERTREGGRALRARKIVKKCPACPIDISDFLQNPQVNRELMDVIESLQQKAKEENVDGSGEEESDLLQKSGEDGSDVSMDGEMSEAGQNAVKKKITDSNGGKEVKSADSETEKGDAKTLEKNPEKRAGKKAKKNGDASDDCKGKASNKGVANNIEGNSMVSGRVTRSSATPEAKKTRNCKVGGTREVAGVSRRGKLLMQADDDDAFQ